MQRTGEICAVTPFGETSVEVVVKDDFDDSLHEFVLREARTFSHGPAEGEHGKDDDRSSDQNGGR